jgi:hypothetical protein
MNHVILCNMLDDDMGGYEIEVFKLFANMKNR